VFGASDTTLCRYNAAIAAESLEQILVQGYNHPQSELEEHKAEIFSDFGKNPPKNLREAAVRIETMAGISRSLPRVGRFLKKGGLKIGR
jgi:hypothetical protein